MPTSHDRAEQYKSSDIKVPEDIPATGIGHTQILEHQSPSDSDYQKEKTLPKKMPEIIQPGSPPIPSKVNLGIKNKLKRLLG